jgi:hypothetical protein
MAEEDGWPAPDEKCSSDVPIAAEAVGPSPDAKLGGTLPSPEGALRDRAVGPKLAPSTEDDSCDTSG